MEINGDSLYFMINNYSQEQYQKGYSLVEVLAIIVILGIISSIGIVSMTKVMQLQKIKPLSEMRLH